MDDKRDPPDEKETLGQTAAALRRSKRLSQGKLEENLRLRHGRVSEIETGTAVTAELIQEIAGDLGYRTLHVLKTMDLFEFLGKEQRKPFDPLGPTPEQEVDLYEACRALGAELEAMYCGRIRREKLKSALDAAAGQWGEVKDLSMSRQRAEIRRNADFHTWAFCLFLCEESIRWATDQPKGAPHVGRLAVLVARCCALPWVERLVAYALAHLANTYRVLGRHRKAELLFGKAHRLWRLPEAAAADPGVLDPGRIFDLEASLRKDQRQLPLALELLERAYAVTRNQARILIKRSLVLCLRGSYEEAIKTLRCVASEPGKVAAVDYNIGVNLCHLGRFEEAASCAKFALKVAMASNSRIRILRCRWLQARVFAGRGDYEDALNSYRTLVIEFGQRKKMTYDAALVTLELVALLIALGNTHECRFFALSLSSYFEAKEIYPEARAALKLFYNSVLQDAATESLARQVASFLYLAQGTPGLRFMPAGS
jgi:tetratricopeptide (TPR) repeat protein